MNLGKRKNKALLTSLFPPQKKRSRRSTFAHTFSLTMMLHEFSTNTSTPAFFPKAMGSIHLLNTLRQKVGKAFPVGGINNSQSGMSIHQKHEERLNFEEFFTC